jgi:hypothetical protein
MLIKKLCAQCLLFVYYFTIGVYSIMMIITFFPETENL